MSVSMSARAWRILVGSCVLLPVFALAGGAATPTAPGSKTPGDPLETAVARSNRPQRDRDRDADRRPAEVLRFCQVGPGDRVGELMAGSGYYTEMLSAVVGLSGHVFAHNSPFVLERFAEKPFSERLARLPLDNVTRLDTEPEEPGFPSDLDVVLLIRFYHDFYWQEVDRTAVNRAVLASLVPGGIYCLLDHHADAGSRDRDVRTLHRVDAAMVKQEVLAAGFEWDEASDLLRNPADDHTWSIFADDAARRDKTDRFLYRFRKPADRPVSGGGPHPEAGGPPVGRAAADSGARGETLLVDVACGQCQLGLPGSGCDLAVRIDGHAYYVDGSGIDDHGDAHADHGLCNAVRRARVEGHVENGRFIATSFELLGEPTE